MIKILWWEEEAGGRLSELGFLLLARCDFVLAVRVVNMVEGVRYSQSLTASSPAAGNYLTRLPALGRKPKRSKARQGIQWEGRVRAWFYLALESVPNPLPRVLSSLAVRTAPPVSYTPHVRVPCQEPAGEGRRFKALLDDQDRCVGVSAAGVSYQVLLGSREGPFLLCGIGLSSYPQEHL